MLLADLLFSSVLIAAVGLWAARAAVRFRQGRTYRRIEPYSDEYWNHSADHADYADRHRRLFDSHSPEADHDGWRVRHVGTPVRCDVCHQDDRFDPVTRRCARCGFVTS